ncbi:MAG: HAD family phosphatase, partial [Candidatus Ratteibacteria bacterium]|nr:HAD family phosphatase [Candidatus Ratteibacteria bacterium]
MIKAVIFDMDGVLVDTEDAVAQATVDMFEELYGTKVKKEEFLPFVGMGAKKYITGVAEKYKVNVDVEKAMERRKDNLEKIALRGEIKSFPSVIELIKEAKNSGIKTAIATSSHRIIMEITLKGAGIDIKNFDAITTAEECKKVKPDPEIFLLTAKKLNIPPKDCLVIEDSPAGIEAAKRGGFFAVGVTNTFPNSQLQQADFVVGDMKELSIKNLGNQF